VGPGRGPDRVPGLIWDITFGAGLLTAVPVALFPVWLIVLSYRLPGHLLAGQAR
jgi:hypothetical protein